MTVIASRSLWGQIFPIALGAVVAGMGLALLTQTPLWPAGIVAVWFVVGGAVFMVFGIRHWSAGGVVLSFDDDGIRWKSLRVPWSDVAGARLVTWLDEYGDPAEAVLVFLCDDAPNPYGRKWSDIVAKEAARRFGEPASGNLLVFGDEDWQWSAADAAREITSRTTPSR